MHILPMKINISLLLLVVCFSSFGQNWCSPGSHWRYSYQGGFGVNGYVEISYSGDTLINSQTASRLTKILRVMNSSGTQVTTFPIGREFTYESNGVVYLRYNNNWDTLFNFNANPGDRWRMAKQPVVPACDSASTILVTDTGHLVLNALSLRYLAVTFNYGPNWSTPISDTILERIGFIADYMLPYSQCDLVLDAHEGGPFRCYQDNAFGSYQPHFIGPCDLLSSGESDEDVLVQFVPNPVRDFIQLTRSPFYEELYVEIYNSGGQLNYAGNVESRIDVSWLPKGLYLLNIRHKQGKSTHRFVKD